MHTFYQLRRQHQPCKLLLIYFVSAIDPYHHARVFLCPESAFSHPPYPLNVSSPFPISAPVTQAWNLPIPGFAASSPLSALLFELICRHPLLISTDSLIDIVLIALVVPYLRHRCCASQPALS